MTPSATEILPPNRTWFRPATVCPNPLIGSSFWVIQIVIWPVDSMFMGQFPYIVTAKQHSSSDMFSENLMTVNPKFCVVLDGCDGWSPTGKQLPQVCAYSQKSYWLFRREKAQYIKLVSVFGVQHWFLLLEGWIFNSSKAKSTWISQGP